MALRVLIIVTIIITLSIGVVSVVCSKEKQDEDKQEEIIKKLDQVIKNQDTIMKDLRILKKRV
ncbi:MAG: hypothetical protein ISS46_02090 [Candidatus Omnitrophica bacterium]|nr:hypothetical protein [Candidatus Omnitrophota bacterium]